MNKRTADKLHSRGLQAGRVVEFYRPGPKAAPAPVPEAPQPNIAVGDILRVLLGNTENVEDVLVLLRDKDGTTGLVSTLAGTGEVVLFMRQIEHNIIRKLNRRDSEEEGPQPA